MPNLAFSPVGPQQPPLHDRGSGEKENANAASSPPVGSITKKAAVAPAGSTVVRSPLESLAAGTSIVCKRDSTCKCPDCDMAAAVFDINDLRQVGGGGGIPSSPTAGGIPPPSGVGGLARSPLAGGASRDVARDDHDGALPTWTPAPAGEGEGRQEAAVMPPKPAVAVVDSPAASPVPDSAARNVPHNAKKADMTATSSAPDGEHDAAVHKQPGESCGGASETAAGGETPAAASAKSAGSKKKGWGFRMARAVFSPLSPRRKQQGDAGGDGKSGTTAALAGELDDEATAAAAGAPPLVETTVELSATAEPAAMSEPAATSEPAAAAELAPPADNEIPSSAGAGMGAGGKHGNTGAADGNDGNDDLLSGDESAQEEEEEGPVEHEDGDAAAAAIGGGTCKPPVAGNAAVAAGVSSSTSVPEDSNAAATGSAACGGMDVFLGERSAAAAAAARRASSGRRLSKDRYFECSSEVEHVLASDSESDSGDKDVDPSSSKEQALESEQTSEQPAPPVNETNSDRISSSLAAAPSTPVTPAAATASSARASSATPMSLLPVVEADSPAAALEAAVAAAKAADVNGDVEPGGITVAADSAPSQKVLVRVAPGEETDVDVGAAAPADEATATQAATATYPPEGSGGEANAHDGKEKGAAQDEAQSQAGGARGLMGLGRRRNRRQGTQLELGMAEAYGHEDHRAKFSQAEVDAKIKERLAEEQSAFEKTVSGLKSTHEADLQAAADKLQQSSSDGNRAKIAARDAEALEREIAMLSERYGEAAAEAKHSGKILLEKEALLDAVTAQLMGLKSDLATTRAEHAAEKQRMTETADSERRARSLAESRLQQLEVAYNKLEDSEREKRAAGILKMKNDMKALAQQQFAGANKQHAALRARLERSEAQTRLLEEAAKEFNAKLETAGQKSTELSGQVEALQNEKVEAAASASRREHVLQQEATALRNDAESRLDEMEAMARERDAANSGRDVSQDALARMAIRNTQLKESVADLEGKVKELEGFCTEALDELDREKVKNAKRIFAEGGK
ncbi:expressed unknown protein [Ectocarpus siliculosus]|uniref:Uncharacterized protein n=1 Tax=Ectocarpus siliculosus TaxID=2880 RepID=D7FRV0_ECTSI|nr:expressed unknown protein [Ectocarpus siliculosus]|eukprot:CBJ30891.1 expressed unknown protein [Ectocarpus siliculosus]